MLSAGAHTSRWGHLTRNVSQNPTIYIAVCYVNAKPTRQGIRRNNIWKKILPCHPLCFNAPIHHGPCFRLCLAQGLLHELCIKLQLNRVWEVPIEINTIPEHKSHSTSTWQQTSLVGSKLSIAMAGDVVRKCICNCQLNSSKHFLVYVYVCTGVAEMQNLHIEVARTNNRHTARNLT